ncbi:phage major capsid protein [Sphingobium phenoxybenzoativorans]|uniref:Phage major capsid protein n=1 Tax=Sphingobium phenoxybenzoativorans TaxID=1592790 RepID=A0A975K5Q8_9SPHN|nr:phage major capsid protein [Sphingobium phenoxybenzoativorans]QUT04834.1 phage major capsid protein [Sphingobium phenoxybenzoativorans]
MKKMSIPALLAAASVYLTLPFTRLQALAPEDEVNPLIAPTLDLPKLPRAIVAASVRAEVSTDVKDLFAQFNKTFEEFKAKNDETLKGKADVVLSEQVDRLNGAMDDLEKSIEEITIQIAAAKLNGGKEQPRDAEYTADFSAYFRKDVASKKMEEIRAAATKTDGEGGYLAPVEWDRTLSGRLKQISKIREYATVQTISGAGFTKVFTDRAIGSGWVGEQASRPATSTPAFTSLAFPLGELYANPGATQGLIDDAEVDIEAWLAGEVSTEFARQEGIAFLSGDGSNKPHGLLTYVTGAANAARHPWGDIKVTNSGAGAAITTDGILGIIYDLPADYEANAKLFINRSSVGALRKLKDAGNNYIWQPAFEAGQPSTISGVPIVDIPGMPIVGANNIVALYGDMAETYIVVDRYGIRVLRDPFTNKPFVQFYTTKRVGGGVKNPDAMKALKIST